MCKEQSKNSCKEKKHEEYRGLLPGQSRITAFDPYLKDYSKKAAFSVRFPNSGFTYSHRTDSSSPPQTVVTDAQREDIEMR